MSYQRAERGHWVKNIELDELGLYRYDQLWRCLYCQEDYVSTMPSVAYYRRCLCAYGSMAPRLQWLGTMLGPIALPRGQ